MNDESERIEVQCSCKKTYRLGLHLAGKAYKCPQCNAVMNVPDLAHATVVYSDEDSKWLASVADPATEVVRLETEIAALSKQGTDSESRVKELREKEEKAADAKWKGKIGCLGVIGLITVFGILMDIFDKGGSGGGWMIGPILFALVVIPSWLHSASTPNPPLESEAEAKKLSDIRRKTRIAERHARMLLAKTNTTAKEPSSQPPGRLRNPRRARFLIASGCRTQLLQGSRYGAVSRLSRLVQLAREREEEGLAGEQGVRGTRRRPPGPPRAAGGCLNRLHGGRAKAEQVARAMPGGSTDHVSWRHLAP